jgi:hypothetical protein
LIATLKTCRTSFLLSTKLDLEHSFDLAMAAVDEVVSAVRTLPTRGDQAAMIRGKWPRLAKAAFAALDGKDCTSVVWGLVKPEGRKSPEMRL